MLTRTNYKRGLTERDRKWKATIKPIAGKWKELTTRPGLCRCWLGVCRSSHTLHVSSSTSTACSPAFNLSSPLLHFWSSGLLYTSPLVTRISTSGDNKLHITSTASAKLYHCQDCQHSYISPLPPPLILCHAHRNQLSDCLDNGLPVLLWARRNTLPDSSSEARRPETRWRQWPPTASWWGPR